MDLSSGNDSPGRGLQAVPNVKQEPSVRKPGAAPKYFLKQFQPTLETDRHIYTWMTMQLASQRYNVEGVEERKKKTNGTSCT
jgi:hypothetical protein